MVVVRVIVIEIVMAMAVVAAAVVAVIVVAAVVVAVTVAVTVVVSQSSGCSADLGDVAVGTEVDVVAVEVVVDTRGVLS